MTTLDRWLAVDLALTTDYTALVVVDRAAEHKYRVPFLRRLERGTSYEATAKVVAKAARQLAKGHGLSVVVDATGVGRPVVEMIRHALDAAAVRCPLVALVITGGNATGGTWEDPTVPKRDLIAAAQVVLEQHRIDVAPSLADGATMMAELRKFTAKTTLAGNTTMEALREGDHDDLVLALSMGVWVAERTAGVARRATLTTVAEVNRVAFGPTARRLPPRQMPGQARPVPRSPQPSDGLDRLLNPPVVPAAQIDANEFLVDTPNPAALDATIQTLGAVLVQSDPSRGTYLIMDGHYVVRAIARDPGFIRFAIEKQGYATVVAVS